MLAKSLSRAIPRNLASKVAVRASSSVDHTPYTERQEKLGRPVSPHVTIYKFPPAAISSIMNRVTGVGLSVGVFGVGALQLMGCDVADTFNIIGNCSLAGSAAKFVVAFPITYHYVAGFRHLLWDNCPDTMLHNDSVQNNSYYIIGGTAVLSAVAALI